MRGEGCVELDCLEKAVALGVDPNSLRTNPLFSMLQRNQAFQQLLTKPAASNPPVKTDLLVDPL
jgi:hypothetical protein